MANLINFIKKNINVFVTILMGFFLYVTLILDNVLVNFNLLSLLLILVYILYLQKIELFSKEDRTISILLTLFFSILTILGNTGLSVMWNQNIGLWQSLLSIKKVICFIGYGTIYYPLLKIVIPKVRNAKVFQNFKYKQKNKYWYYVLVIFCCWLPYFIINFPGFFTSDSISELGMVASNLSNITDHHTVIHILFSYFPYQLGMLLFKNSTIAASMIIITQMIIMSLIFAKAITFMVEKKVNQIIIVLTTLFYALCPIHSFYSIIMWKDIIFSGLVLLLTIELIKLLERKKITLRNSKSFIIISILTVFFRNNAIYMYVILALVTMIIFRKQLKTIMIMLLIVFGTYFLVKGPIYNYFDIKTSSSAEYIAIPLQQISRMVYKDVKLTKKEEKLISQLMPLETMKKQYNPEILDSIKFHSEYNSKVFDENKFEYLKLWISLCIKHFDIATESYLMSTMGYWYPNINYWTVLSQIDPNDLGIERTELSKMFDPITNALVTKKIPMYGFIWSIGLGVWIVFINIILSIYFKNKKILYIYVPMIGIWLTMMVATPVFAEFRYIYSLYTTLPILLLAPHLKIKEK